jgi:hypothetical protein
VARPESKAREGLARPRVPDDPAGFVALAQDAANAYDTAWPLTVYAPDIRLEVLGDGIHDVHNGIDDVRPALELLYGWFDRTQARISKTLVATSSDTIVNLADGVILNGQTIHGAEFWKFDQHGQVVHNLLYTSVNPKPLSHPLALLRMLIGHPRPALTHLAVQLRQYRRPAPTR